MQYRVAIFGVLVSFHICQEAGKDVLDIISIHGECFSGDSRLDNVILPSKIKEIRGNTFENCIELSSIIIPEGVTRIGGHAFYGCRKLSYVSVPTTVVEIGSSAFRRCYSLKSIKVPKNAVINERAFKGSPTSIQYLRGETYGQWIKIYSPTICAYNELQYEM